MRTRSTSLTLVLLGSLALTGVASGQAINFESKYLNNKVQGYHGYHIRGKLNGSATLTLDPNSCSLDQYGSRTICTKIALTVKKVKLAELEILDPTGLGRRLFAVSGHGLINVDLRLVTTKNAKDGWFVLTDRGMKRTVVDLDPVPKKKKKGKGKKDKETCVPLACRVDGTVAKAKVVPGTKTGTWILILSGKKPHGGSTVKLQPLVYVKRPEYWGIKVVECYKGFVTDVITPYKVSNDITASLGTKGIELIFKDKKVRIQVPTK